MVIETLKIFAPLTYFDSLLPDIITHYYHITLKIADTLDDDAADDDDGDDGDDDDDAWRTGSSYRAHPNASSDSKQFLHRTNLGPI